MRILLIVPDLGLNVENEIEWITRSYHTEVLSGVVTPARIFEHIAGRRFDIVHFGSHGNEDGVQLSNGTMLSMFEVERLARTVGASLLYLNSCSSARLAQFAVDQGIRAVIASTHRLDDTVIAWSVATSFYQSLLEKGDYYQAYETSKPRDGTLSFYSNGHLVSRQVKPLLDKMVTLETALDTSNKQKDELQRQMRLLLYSSVGTWIFVIAELVLIMLLMGW